MLHVNLMDLKNEENLINYSQGGLGLKPNQVPGFPGLE